MSDETETNPVEQETLPIEAPQTQVAVRYDDLELTFAQRLILDPSIDLDRVTRVLEMEKEAERERQRKAFIEAKIQVQAKIPVIRRNKENKHTQSTYADLAAIDAVVTPILKEHGFTTDASAGASEKEGHIAVTFTTSHSEGHSESFTIDWPLDTHGTGGEQNKTGVQGIKSTTTIARRAMKMMAFDIADGDNDGNAVEPLSGDTLSPEQVKTLQDGLKALGKPEEAFLQFMASQGVTVASELASVPVESYRVMEATIAGFAKKQGDKV